MDLFRLGLLKLGENEKVLIGDPCYFDDSTDACAEIALNWPAGEYYVYLFTENGKPHALALRRSPEAFHLPTLSSEDDAEAWLGVDSGQMAIAADSALLTWTETPDCDFDDPQSDYDFACRATLRSQLGADFLRNRSERHGSSAWAQVGTAVASGTKFGDGEYPLVVSRNRRSEIVGLVVLFDGWEVDPNDN